MEEIKRFLQKKNKVRAFILAHQKKPKNQESVQFF